MYKLYCVVLATIFAETYGLILENAQLVENSLIANIISQFNQHNIIFHYDNNTKNKVDAIIAEANIDGSILLKNFDMQSKPNDCSAVMRPIGYKFSHVVLLQNYSRFNEYANASRFSFHYLDIILVITNITIYNNVTAVHFPMFLNNIHRAGAFFILNLWNFILYNVCFYCFDKFEKWQKIIDLSELAIDYNPDIKTILMNIYENQFKDFNGHVFPVGYAMYKPFFWCNLKKESNRSRIFEIYGSEGELLILLHEKLHFEVMMVKFVENENTWSSVIEAVQNGTLSWAVGGISSSIKRLGVVEFTNYVNTEPYVVLYSIYKNPWMSWRNIILPFQMFVWIILILTIISISSLFFLAIIKMEENTNIKFNYFLHGCLRFFVEQPIPFIRTVMKTRWTTTLLMCLCLIVALIMTNAYKSKLTSSLINFKAEEYNDVDILVNLNYEFYLSNIDSSVLRENLKMSEDEVFIKILNRSKNDSDLCSSIYETVGNKNAVIDEETNIQYATQEYCRKRMTLANQEDLRIVRHALIQNQHAWPMPLNTPYRTAFNTIISRLHAAGIINKWNSDYAFLVQIVPKSNKKRSRHFQSSRTKVTIISLIGPASVWIVGLITATVIFIIELIYGTLN